MKNQCVVIVIKNYVRLENMVLVGSLYFQSLSDLQKVDLDEPYYWVNVDGKRVKLDDYRLFIGTEIV